MAGRWLAACETREWPFFWVQGGCGVLQRYTAAGTRARCGHNNACYA